MTLPRHAVDAVVTEHGTAVLAGPSLRERASALLAVTAPQLRDEVAAGWESDPRHESAVRTAHR